MRENGIFGGESGLVGNYPWWKLLTILCLVGGYLGWMMIDGYGKNDNNNGCYSMKSAYTTLTNSLTDILHNSKFSLIWNLHIPPKVSVFFWRILRSALPTIDNLKKRSILVPNYDYMCPLCGVDEESLDHVLLWYDAIWCIWLECYSWFNFSMAFPESIQQHFCQHVLISSSMDENSKWRVLWCAISWVLWNWRNNITFRDKVFYKDKILHDILYQSWSWLRAFDKKFCYSFLQWEANTVEFIID